MRLSNYLLLGLLAQHVPQTLIILAVFAIAVINVCFTVLPVFIMLKIYSKWAVYAGEMILCLLFREWQEMTLVTPYMSKLLLPVTISHS